MSSATALPEPLPDRAALASTAALLGAMANPARLSILVALSRRGPLSVTELQEVAELEQTATSHQLRVLRDARLVTAQRSGRRVLYQLADHHVVHIIEDALKHAAEGDGP